MVPREIEMAVAAPKSIWFLVGCLRQGEPASHLPIHSSPFSIGRSPKALLCLPHETVSSLHAEIIQQDGTVVIRDLGSTNGTFLNGDRIEAAELCENDLVQFGDTAFRALQQDSDATSGVTATEDVYDQALALVQFDRLLHEGAAIPQYQPIVDLQAGNKIIGYEALGRSSVVGLETPTKMFDAARRLSLERELSAMLRWRAIEESVHFETVPHLFLNTHPAEFEKDIAEPLTRARAMCGKQPLTLEIHERVFTSLDAMYSLRDVLRALDISLAYDDFGSGQDRLRELAVCPPDYIKFDMALIRGIDKAATSKQQLVEGLVEMVRDLNVISLAEGIETSEEMTWCRQTGFDLAQGFLFGRPCPSRAYR